MYLKEYAEAIQDYTRVIELFPEFAPIAYHNRGVAKNSIQDKTGACYDWQKARALGFKDAEKMIKKYCN